MSRVQLALNVSDLDAAVDFYSKLFATEPAKRRPGYANFAIDEPPLKLVLIENAGAPGTLNHLGVEVGLDRRGRRRPGPPRRARAWPRRPRRTSPAATPCRTRCGSTTPTARRGRSTRCWPTARRRTATCDVAALAEAASDELTPTRAERVLRQRH